MLKQALRKVGRGANTVLRHAGVELVPAGRHNFEDQEAYLPLEATLKAAADAGLSVGDYIDTVMNKTPGATQATIDAMSRLGVFEQKGGTIVEIGPGSGRYLERVMRAAAPSRYEIYETAKPWAAHLVRTYGVVWQPTNGYTLDSTPAASVDLVHAHKVFNSINFMPACSLWQEMVRVTRPGGHCVFDIMTERCLSAEMISRWVASGIRAGSYPAAMPRGPVVEFFEAARLTLIESFIGPLGPGTTEVFVFRKREQGPEAADPSNCQPSCKRGE